MEKHYVLINENYTARQVAEIIIKIAKEFSEKNYSGIEVSMV